MELETRKSCYLIPSKWCTSATDRFSTLYEKGKSQVAAEREMKLMVDDEGIDVDEGFDAGHATGSHCTTT